jgi:addiction module HigA family antidote
MLPTHRKPTHPGEILKYEFVEPFELTQKELAEQLGVSVRSIHELLCGRGRISPELALRLSQYFTTTPQFWLNLQYNVDLWNAMQAKRQSIYAIKPHTSKPHQR